MATYYSSPNNQRENAPILYSRELPTSFAEASVLPPNMLIYMNSDSYSDAAMAASSQQPSNCIDMPSMAASQHQQQQQNILSNLGDSRTGENDFSEWRDSSKNDLVVTHAMTGAPSFVHGGQGLQGQGLSLSLGTQIPSGISFRNPNMGFASFLSPNASNSRGESPRNVEYLAHQDSNKGELSPYAMSSVARAVPSSKYLKAAQQLLDEVVNVRKALKQNEGEKAADQRLTSPKEGDDGSKSESTPGGVDSGGNSQPELSHAEKQELQNKLTKLLSMLDEVDRRYKQYYHQMQIVVSSFDAIAGCGSAKPYTALALQTISRHFRCLRDAIAGQIKATRKSLGEEDSPGNIRGVGISRLRFVDQQLRQQRALQQLGMMQQHAWRPQRGLPESSVSILRAWLFEHFLHPYPKDSDKIMLARQTGLTRSQVSNWFINARVRLWKPMVEEMYKEETGDADMDSNSSSETAGKPSKGDTPASADRREDPQQQSASSTGTSLMDNAKTDHLAPDVEMAGPDYESMMRRSEEHHRRPAPTHEYGLYPDAIAAYQMSELGRFSSGGGVSLTLGLQHCDGVVPMAHGAHQHQHGFVADDGMYGAGNATEGADFDSQPRFASASHLLHDFVV